ncbi:sugar nucleotide-binding protein [Biformimicrobium ophioploci]|uniref:dTDP-4-dehydrorhamnose reductase n=1 Tax=Biformimicrobium ophioploci TaxID=3036711 RepID=A0ABQ6M2P9_9GAMM|nr:sugar nucleotide-binding protein [Microbulbifer sp. NKW57]GMG88613.1 hypothetical protein MNKW57_29340 [Microbulbifer sp. NKW57]
MSILNPSHKPDTLLVESGTVLDQELVRALEGAGFACRVLSVDQLLDNPASVTPDNPLMVVNASAYAGEAPDERAVRAAGLLAGAELELVLHLSSYQVFGGGKRREFSEQDAPAPLDATGSQWLACEEALAEKPHCAVLRLPWVMDISPAALLGRVLAAVDEGKALQLDDRAEGNPVTCRTVARVVQAILLQFSAGATPQPMLFQCGASDTCTEAAFAGEVFERARSLREDVAEPVLEPGNGERRSAVLATRHLRYSFGIQPRSWREGLNRLVEVWLEKLGAQTSENPTQH